MSENSPSPQNTPSSIELRCEFVRYKNVLLAQGDFSELFVDYYLHLAEHDIHPHEAHDQLFKDALAAFTLHCASRPKNETLAWTIHLQNPRINLFLGGDTELGQVAGRIFTTDVRDMQGNFFYADVARPGQPTRRSAVLFPGNNLFRAAEQLYQDSEQRPARFFTLSAEEHLLATAHPDCDLEWFAALTDDNIRALLTKETVVPIERRLFRWSCGCNQLRIMSVLAPTMRESPEALFGDANTVQVQCPRCSGRYNITREALEAYISEHQH